MPGNLIDEKVPPFLLDSYFSPILCNKWYVPARALRQSPGAGERRMLEISAVEQPDRRKEERH